MQDSLQVCTGLKKLPITEKTATIGDEAYYRCEGITSAVLPKGLKKIGNGAFSACLALKSVTIEDNVINIGDWAFAYTSLTKITIPESVTFIGEDICYYCSNLKSVYVVKGSKADAAFTEGKNNGDNAGLKKYVYKQDGHYYNDVLTKATLTTDGKIVSTCTVCGHSKVTKTIPHPSSFKLSATAIRYDGTVKKPTVTVKDVNGNTIASSNYTVTYASGRKNIGTYKVTVKMGGNYTGTKELSFRIKGNLGYAVTKVSVQTISAKTYTGLTFKPTPTVKAIGTSGTVVTLKNGTDYKLTYTNNKYVGKASVKISGIGNYSGSKTVYFKINPKGTTIKTVAPLSKGVKVTWNKQGTQTTGYQVRISSKSDFSTKSTKTIAKTGTLTCSFTGLKGNTKYYVKVRTYKKLSDGSVYYSAWSGVKTVTTKA